MNRAMRFAKDHQWSYACDVLWVAERDGAYTVFLLFREPETLGFSACYMSATGKSVGRAVARLELDMLTILSLLRLEAAKKASGEHAEELCE